MKILKIIQHIAYIRTPQINVQNHIIIHPPFHKIKIAIIVWTNALYTDACYIMNPFNSRDGGPDSGPVGVSMADKGDINIA